jgi:hypothetical protein
MGDREKCKKENERKEKRPVDLICNLGKRGETIASIPGHVQDAKEGEIEVRKKAENRANVGETESKRKERYRLDMRKCEIALRNLWPKKRVGLNCERRCPENWSVYEMLEK